MLQYKKPPVVLLFKTTFSNVTQDALDFGRDSFDGVLAVGDYIYFGRHKPFTDLYVEMATVSSVDAGIDLQYWNGSAWTSLDDLDDTKGFKRSGFLHWSAQEDWAETTVNTIQKYWVRFAVTVGSSAGTLIQGIGPLFSDDQDLKAIFPGILNYRASAETSFVLRHQNSRNQIVQEIRNHALQKNYKAGTERDFEAWDFLKIHQVNMWSVYLTLANIFSSLQSKEDGLYKQKTEEYTQLAEDYKADYLISLDFDDDGKVDLAEENFNITVKQLVRR